MKKINLKELLVKCKQNNEIINRLQKEIDENKKIFNKFFKVSDKKSFSYDGNSCYRVERNKIKYDINKIEANINRNLTKYFIDKNYNVNFAMFKQICKHNKIDYKIFRKAFTIDKQINENKLNELYENNKISLEDLKGCYELQKSESIAIRYNK